MSFLNIEIKATCSDPGAIRDFLLANGADFRGVDEQTDTYFNVQQGRLKLREGRIENNLIYYQRADQSGPRASDFSLVKVEDARGMKELLERSIGIRIVVRKRREIYYIGNVKFHLDEVPGLGSFVEIEAGNLLADHTKEELLQQCNYYMEAFRIKEADLLQKSYSDMLEA